MSEEGGRMLLVATRSPHKLAELRALLHLDRTRLVSLDEIGWLEEATEDAATFRGNAIAKARFYSAVSSMPTLADDSGLEVDALDGRPGIRTRRYAGEAASDAQNNDLLLRELGALPSVRRTARYRCVLAFLDPGQGTDPIRPWVVTRSGTFEGRIATTPRGDNGFGYDPIFEPLAEAAGGRTVGEMTGDEKNRRSHRARAARAMGRYLRSEGY